MEQYESVLRHFQTFPLTGIFIAFMDVRDINFIMYKHFVHAKLLSSYNLK